MDKPVIALFDFDGTLTRRDTLPLFIRHAVGWSGLLCAMISTLPAMIVLACNGWKSIGGISAGNTKEKLLKRCFCGKTTSHIDAICHDFAHNIDQVIAPAVVDAMKQHIEQGHKVVIVSASVDVWIKPWAARYGVRDIIATRLEIDNNNRYTGHFMGENCNGDEKVQRIARMYTPAHYHIVAYGNSSGDYPMLHFAHEAYMCKNNSIRKFK